MDLDKLFGGSFVNWEAVDGSWTKRTISSRLLLLAARRYLSGANPERQPDAERAEAIGASRLPDEVKRAYATLPGDAGGADAGLWGAFVDAALATELEIVSYGERPPLLNELRVGLGRAATEAGEGSDLAGWFMARSDALPGEDLPEDPQYLPV
ncbi:MAG: hypothetical protein H0V83_09635 [Rubrobacter sp.]|nr:hypothetical protein [Rubrobacter sp.]